jgi:hypothetical protein
MSDAIGHLRLEGALFFRSELTDPFEFDSTPLALADALVPGADRLTLFHIVASGSCWVAVDDGVRYWADEGDIIVMPYADHYAMGGEGAAECVSILSLLDPLPWTEMPVLRHGGGGRRTDIVCGYMHTTDPLFDPGMRALPPVFVVRLPSGPAAKWVRASIDYAVADAVPPSNLSSNPVASRLPELLLTEVLRVHLATAPAIDRGWIAALRDPILAPAVAALHRDPAQRWTVGVLARQVGASRSSLDERFGRCSDSRRSATSPLGGCISPPICSRRPSCRCSRSPAASATSPRRRSAGPSSASGARHRATGGPPRDASEATPPLRSEVAIGGSRGPTSPNVGPPVLPPRVPLLPSPVTGSLKGYEISW